ncbi:fimbrial assembly protein fimC [Erwinia sp. CPCC 100877]|nr:fimbrial assembly protein fimC [Erwinia sp. CPCC 100877]
MKKKLTSFHLKVIAIIAMFLNHMGNGWGFNEISPPLFFFTEFIGNLTFPIMAFLLVEGFHYTRNVKKYALRLLLFGLISSYPFHLLFYPEYPYAPIELANNIFFTLLMGLLLIILCEKTSNTLVHVLLVIIFSLGTVMSDWNIVGVLMIYGFYRIKKPIFQKIIPPLYTTGVLFIIMLLAYVLSHGKAVPWYEPITILGILGVIPLLLNYDGTRGYSPTWVKWGFYVFYPLHMIVLILIRSFI